LSNVFFTFNLVGFHVRSLCSFFIIGLAAKGKMAAKKSRIEKSGKFEGRITKTFRGEHLRKTKIGGDVFQKHLHCYIF